MIETINEFLKARETLLLGLLLDEGILQRKIDKEKSYIKDLQDAITILGNMK